MSSWMTTRRTHHREVNGKRFIMVIAENVVIVYVNFIRWIMLISHWLFIHELLRVFRWRRAHSTRWMRSHLLILRRRVSVVYTHEMLYAPINRLNKHHPPPVHGIQSSVLVGCLFVPRYPQSLSHSVPENVTRTLSPKCYLFRWAFWYWNNRRPPATASSQPSTDRPPPQTAAILMKGKMGTDLATVWMTGRINHLFEIEHRKIGFRSAAQDFVYMWLWPIWNQKTWAEHNGWLPLLTSRFIGLNKIFT